MYVYILIDPGEPFLLTSLVFVCNLIFNDACPSQALVTSLVQMFPQKGLMLGQGCLCKRHFWRVTVLKFPETPSLGLPPFSPCVCLGMVG